MINKITHNITTIVAIAAMIIGGMVQFHHHLANGNVCVVYDEFIKSVIEQEYPVQKHCNHESIPTPDTQECSFKLDLFNPNDNYNHGNLILPAILAIYAHSTHIPILPCFDVLQLNDIFYKNILTHTFKVSITGLRSPPTLIK